MIHLYQRMKWVMLYQYFWCKKSKVIKSCERNPNSNPLSLIKVIVKLSPLCFIRANVWLQVPKVTSTYHRTEDKGDEGIKWWKYTWNKWRTSSILLISKSTLNPQDVESRQYIMQFFLLFFPHCPTLWFPDSDLFYCICGAFYVLGHEAWIYLMYSRAPHYAKWKPSLLDNVIISEV